MGGPREAQEIPRGSPGAHGSDPGSAQGGPQKAQERPKGPGGAQEDPKLLPGRENQQFLQGFRASGPQECRFGRGFQAKSVAKPRFWKGRGAQTM